MIGLARALLIAILVLGVALKIATRGADAAPGDPAAQLAQVFPSRLSAPVRIDPPVPHAPLVMRATVSGCDRPLTIFRIAPSFTELGMLRGLVPVGDKLRYAYLDWSSDRPDRTALLRRRLLSRAARLVGLGPYTDLRSMLVIDEAPACHVAEDADWRRFWLKRPPSARQGG